MNDATLRDFIVSLAVESQMYWSDYIARGGRTHTLTACNATRKAGGPTNCVMHRPSIHKLTGSRQILRSSGLIEDQCQHGVGHPNPDSSAYLRWSTSEKHWGTHGCDGCCGPVTAKPKRPKYDWMEGDFPT